jgi:AcrR family transcriptional regulator
MKSALSRRDGNLKERIDRAALQLFADRGADATPVPMIAEAAGVAVGSLYRYYANKEEMVARLYAENYAELAAMLNEAQADKSGAQAKLGAMIRVICGFFDREWDIARFLLLEQHARLRSYTGPANPVDVVRQVVTDGIARGEIRPLAPLVAVALVMGPVVQAATFRTYGRLNGPLEGSADDIIAAVWAALASEKSPKSDDPSGEGDGA